MCNTSSTKNLKKMYVKTLSGADPLDRPPLTRNYLFFGWFSRFIAVAIFTAVLTIQISGVYILIKVLWRGWGGNLKMVILYIYFVPYFFTYLSKFYITFISFLFEYQSMLNEPPTWALATLILGQLLLIVFGCRYLQVCFDKGFVLLWTEWCCTL